MQYNVKQSVKNILLDKVLINNEGISLLYIIDYLCHESWSWGIDNKAAYSNLLFFFQTFRRVVQVVKLGRDLC